MRSTAFKLSSSFVCWTIASLVLLAHTGVLPAQPPPAGQPNPQAPTIAPPFPMGMQRGTALELNLTGTNLADPVAVMTSFPAKVVIPTENNNGKDNAKLLVRLEVPKDASIGWHALRVVTTRGVSNLRPFCIDDLPQLAEKDGNRTLATAQPITPPCVVCGKADAEVKDYFKFSVQAGQRLSFEVLGRRLGGSLQGNRPFDPRISLYDLRTGREIAYSDDAPGLSKDPRMTHTFKEPGEYAIEIYDVGWLGSGDWFYRLRIGDFPCATTPVPLAAKRGSNVQVSFAGPHVEGIPPMPVTVPTAPDIDAIWLTPAFSPGGPPGWPVPLAITDRDEAMEIEPNDEPAQATRVNVPAAISARFLKKGERDHFVFKAAKGQRVIVEAQTQELHSPTMVYMVLKDAKGGQVGVSNPANDPARIDFTAPADGDLTLAVEHLHYWGGPEESYRLTFLPPEPGFSLTALLDRVDVPLGTPPSPPLPGGAGGGAVITVQATRRDYAGPIEVSVGSPPGVSGVATIPAGQTAALMVLAPTPDARIGGYPLVLFGKATVNNSVVIQRANIRGIISRELANLPFPPASLTHEMAVAVTEKPPFTLVAKTEAEGLRGGSVPVTIAVTKAAGFDEEITVTSIGLPVPQGQPVLVPPVNAKVAKGQAEAKVELKPAANAPLGALPVAFVGRTKYQGRDYAVTAVPPSLALVLPFELQVDTSGGKMTAEGKHKIKVKAVRKAGYKGPIMLEVQNLPANVTAAKATIAENQNEAEIELTAAANAAVGDKADVKVEGTATGAANQKNASANFTLSVMKK